MRTEAFLLSILLPIAVIGAGYCGRDLWHIKVAAERDVDRALGVTSMDREYEFVLAEDWPKFSLWFRWVLGCILWLCVLILVFLTVLAGKSVMWLIG